MRPPPWFDEDPSATLTIVSDTMSPNEITSLLQIEPTDTVVKGDFVCEYNSKKFLSPTNLWDFSSAEEVQSIHLYEHLNWMVEQIHGKSPAFRALEQAGADVRLNLEVRTINYLSGGWIEPNIMRLLAQFNVEVKFRVRFDLEGQEEDDDDNE